MRIPTKQKRRSTGQGAKKPLDPQGHEKTWVPAGASGHELSRPKRVSWLPASGMMSATSIPVSCVGVKTHFFMDDLSPSSVFFALLRRAFFLTVFFLPRSDFSII